MKKIKVFNHSRYTFDSVNRLIQVSILKSGAPIPDTKTTAAYQVTIHVNDARGPRPRLAIFGSRSARLYLPKPETVVGTDEYLHQVHAWTVARYLRWAVLTMTGRKAKDLNDDQKTYSGPVPWVPDIILTSVRARLTKQAPNKEAARAKLHAKKIKTAEEKIEYYNRRAGKAVVLRTKWERKLRGLKQTAHLVGKMRGYKPKQLTEEDLAELDTTMNASTSPICDD